MKKITILLTLTLLLSVTINAQRRQNQRNGNRSIQTPEQIATLQSKRMALALDLDKKQLDAVYTLMKENAEDRAKLRAERQNSTNQDRPQRFDLKSSRLDKQIAMKAEMKKILNADQFQKWEEIRGTLSRNANNRMNNNNNRSCQNQRGQNRGNQGRGGQNQRW